MFPSKAARRAAFFTLLAAAFAAGPAAAQAQKWKSYMSTDEPDKLYRHYCSVCHGDKGDGQTVARFTLDPAPRDFTSEKAREELSRDHMLQVLMKGSFTKDGKRTAMVSWKDSLSPEQMETVVDYVIVKFMEGRPADNVHDHNDPRHKHHDHTKAKQVDYPYGLQTDAVRGKTVYAASCQSCHGDKGDGKGLDPRVAQIKPRNFLSQDFRDYATGFSLFSSVSRGRGHVPAWDKNLSNQEIADVSEYIMRAYVRQDPTLAKTK
jgi:mono/diheme cytochrome c family protein